MVLGKHADIDQQKSIMQLKEEETQLPGYNIKLR
jgi:hypothetical protein